MRQIIITLWPSGLEKGVFPCSHFTGEEIRAQRREFHAQAQSWRKITVILKILLTYICRDHSVVKWDILE